MARTRSGLPPVSALTFGSLASDPPRRATPNPIRETVQEPVHIANVICAGSSPIAGTSTIPDHVVATVEPSDLPPIISEQAPAPLSVAPPVRLAPPTVSSTMNAGDVSLGNLGHCPDRTIPPSSVTFRAPSRNLAAHHRHTSTISMSHSESHDRLANEHNPHFISSGDHPDLILITLPLSDHNFQQWRRDFNLAL
uniref:Retrotransposon Copia-like N-terminal domain-containing protein n=1 Tax=Cannabis sativa TaxID=3483 RepID=A0A803PSP8_CANSA